MWFQQPSTNIPFSCYIYIYELESDSKIAEVLPICCVEEHRPSVPIAPYRRDDGNALASILDRIIPHVEVVLILLIATVSLLEARIHFRCRLGETTETLCTKRYQSSFLVLGVMLVRLEPDHEPLLELFLLFLRGTSP